jgi:hypothetical protein
MSNLPVIAGVEIFVDREGRYNLNALHKAYEREEGRAFQNKAPAKWFRTQQVREYVDYVDGHICPSPVVSKKGGLDQGTFAHELIAIEYAGWLSPKFRAVVNQTFIDYRTGKLQPKTLNDPTLQAVSIMLAEIDALKTRQMAVERAQREAELNSLKRDRKLARNQAQLDRKFQAIETAQDYFTILGWWHLTFTTPLDNTKAAKYGRMASRYCREHNFEIGQVQDPRFGLVNTYPREVLELLFLD